MIRVDILKQQQKLLDKKTMSLSIKGKTEKIIYRVSNSYTVSPVARIAEAAQSHNAYCPQYNHLHSCWCGVVMGKRITKSLLRTINYNLLSHELEYL